MRLTVEQLQEMMIDTESDRIERTVSVDKTDKFAQAVCAFANDFPNHQLPGYLLLGVKDNGTPSGLQVTDQLLQNLAALRSDGNIQPLPAMTVQKYSLPSGDDIAIVEVFPADLPPVRYKNPILAEAMKTLGYVNKFGSGVLRAQQALAKNGHPPAEFQFESNYFLTIIRGIEK
jgi:ATP-dependent DNA helicase RecG